MKYTLGADGEFLNDLPEKSKHGTPTEKQKRFAYPEDNLPQNLTSRNYDWEDQHSGKAYSEPSFDAEKAFVIIFVVLLLLGAIAMSLSGNVDGSFSRHVYYQSAYPCESWTARRHNNSDGTARYSDYRIVQDGRSYPRTVQGRNDCWADYYDAIGEE